MLKKRFFQFFSWFIFGSAIYFAGYLAWKHDIFVTSNNGFRDENNKLNNEFLSDTKITIIKEDSKTKQNKDKKQEFYEFEALSVKSHSQQQDFFSANNKTEEYELRTFNATNPKELIKKFSIKKIYSKNNAWDNNLKEHIKTPFVTGEKYLIDSLTIPNNELLNKKIAIFYNNKLLAEVGNIITKTLTIQMQK